MEGPCADSVEKHEPASDVAIVMVDSLKALDPKRPTRESRLMQCSNSINTRSPRRRGRVTATGMDRCAKNQGSKRPSVARVKCIVQIDASENGEHIGLQEGHQKLERIQQYDHDERKRGDEQAEYPGAPQHDDEAGKDLERNVAGEHTGRTVAT